MLAIIHNDHINMSRLLKILKQKIELLKKDEKIDFRLVETIITYLRIYSDKYHHPLEDLIYDYYINNYGRASDAVSRLSEQHKGLKKVTVELDELLNMVLLDAVVPKEQCIEKLQNFVELQSAHLTYEEQEVLPLIKEALSPQDWIKVGLQWQHKDHEDPLFGDKVSQQYHKLASIIKQM